MSEERRSLLDSARKLGDSLLAALLTRLELIATEVQEEKARILGILAFGAAALMLLGFGVLFLALTITVLFWDDHRLLVLTLLSVAFLLGGAMAMAMARRLLKAQPRIFDATINELKRDRLTLNGAGDD